MRVAIVTESFPPDLNGVAHSVVRVAEHLVARGHEPLVVAPAPAPAAAERAEAGAHPYPVVRVPSLPVPLYRSFRLGLPSRRLTEVLAEHAPDVVHLASPFVLGARGLTVARRLRLPTLAVYQTDVAAYARAYHLGWSVATVWRWLREIHNAADRTLAPSTAAAADLTANGIDRVRIWGRGIDPVRFDPARRCEQTRRELAPGGETLVGYVGRLAAEKRVDLLAETSRLPGVRVVVVGDGPARKELERALPAVRFLGARHGRELARLYASFDVFTHTGPHETFGQTVQEAQASGVPVVAPAAGGPMDLVVSGVTGLLVPPGDPTALAGAVAGLVADPARRARYGRAARAAVAGRTWAAIGDELIEHYRAVLDAPGVVARLPVAA
ncbi:phosphatidylinositol alpha 1,6-mannosyltransferase [Micromonospora sp. Llam0]|uniref:glycosyltransferase family 4 protein n=1 Tax=Micromonospora sp. Llam0 TaxID=2485143 RepID=UPI000F461770|nr:glycosyltransferase family 1 protein [Micromonospora sp. Llam0]ROO58320.1 phosphatidylinositol alpha 1,6-mannosyltransferase [Micromonospora sp. Llam0]